MIYHPHGRKYLNFMPLDFINEEFAQAILWGLDHASEQERKKRLQTGIIYQPMRFPSCDLSVEFETKIGMFILEVIKVTENMWGYDLFGDGFAACADRRKVTKKVTA